MRSALLSLGAVLLLVSGCGNSDSSGTSSGTTVKPGQSIQAAVDAAAAGDTITVEPGDYTESSTSGEAAIHITKPLTLIANSSLPDKRVRILPSTGQRHGILVEPAKAGDPDVDGIEIKGFTVEGFSNNGIWLRHVTNFNIEGNESINNLENGIWPTISANGEVKKNVAYGSLDSALWVEASENVRIVDNELHHSPTGLEITVSNDIHMEGNVVHDNVVGIGLYPPESAGLPPNNWPSQPFRNWNVIDNHVYENNLPNPVTGGTVGQLPPGGGVLVLGVDTVTVQGNTIENNDFFGIAMTDYCVAVAGTPISCEDNPPIVPDTAPEFNKFVSNDLSGNGNNAPPGPFSTLGSDILALGGSNNCSSDNTATKVIETPVLPPC
jgi:parallel beta-helix repeat protein